MPASRRHLRLLAAACALSLVGAACGDDDDSAADPTIEDTGGDDGTAEDGATDDVAPDDGGGDGGDGGEAVDACALITTDELAEIIGSPYDEGEPLQQQDTGTSQCTWGNTDAPPAKTLTITVDTTESLQGGILGQAVDSAEQYYELQKGNATVDEELDLGDDAYRSGSGILILDGDTVYGVLAPGGTSDEAITALKAVAAAIID